METEPVGLALWNLLHPCRGPVEALEQALQGHRMLVALSVQDADWEHISQCKVFVGSRIHCFIIRRGFMKLRNTDKAI